MGREIKNEAHPWDGKSEKIGGIAAGISCGSSRGGMGGGCFGLLSDPMALPSLFAHSKATTTRSVQPRR